MQSLNLLVYILTSSVVLFALYILIIFIKHNFRSNTKNKGIAVLLLFIFIRFLSEHLYFTGNINMFPHFLFVNEIIIRFSTPVLFLLVYSIYTDKNVKWWQAFHLIPFLFLIINFHETLLLTAEAKREVLSMMENKGYDYIWTLGLFTNYINVEIFNILYLGVYTCLTAYYITRTSPSVVVPDHLKKISKLIFWFLFTNFLPALLITLDTDWVDKYLIINVLGFIFALSILIGFFYAPQFLYGNSYLLFKSSNQRLGNKVDNHLEENKTIQKILLKIEAYFIDTTDFLHTNFSLEMLESALEVSGNELEIAFKEKYNMNFDQLLTFKRLEYFQFIFIKIPSNQEKPIEQIAKELGFKNIQFFKTVFKEHFGMTVKEFLASPQK
jgi:AraC-like DNA-binding protein